MKAHDRVIAEALRPVSVRGSEPGGIEATNFPHAVHSVARPGPSSIPASTIPRRARVLALQLTAMAIRRLTDASSRKSMLSAKSETDRIAAATANSIPKYATFRIATMMTTLRRFSIMTWAAALATASGRRDRPPGKCRLAALLRLRAAVSAGLGVSDCRWLFLRVRAGLP